MCWQEVIGKPDSLLCDKKSEFSLREQENTWRNSNQRVSLTCHLQSVKAVYQCQGKQEGTPPHYQAPVCCCQNLFLLACLSTAVTVQGAFLPLGPQRHLWSWLGIRRLTEKWIIKYLFVNSTFSAQGRTTHSHPGALQPLNHGCPNPVLDGPQSRQVF